MRGRLVEAIKQNIPVAVKLVRWSRRIGERLNPYPATPTQPMAKIFTDIYQANYWANASSKSGHGSDLHQTHVLRAGLPLLLSDIRARTVLDIPCGDFFWMNHCDLELDHYIGADIVHELISHLRMKYGSANRSFEVLNLTSDPLPKVDLVLCRDALVHFSHADARNALRNIKRSGSLYLLTTTFVGRPYNHDIETGQWRPLNLQKPPFSLPAPLAVINEDCSEGGGDFGDKCLGLWRLGDL